ncbi:glycerol-3-phosphate dehydrogenase/oxidase [Paenisporosarcina sp. OV554]|uniref:glycerol-3-phosphate dehydrogenase/oxidase n=1 Tax=Paenisporosarcina sp. OV554 TaxID=2135694 RepID=UPI000D368EB4|nr:glycerol-3-phosphate dehydrogenase/oxidase [Paenisporosarcina sp. OV554]PUB18228.1 homodimeric glycerol 3-phosphate dehydrogenase (quinone) [Paenisporosarcina sp. OV554]
MLSAIGRSTNIQTLNTFEFDLLVIGGGITGAGIALDAVTRGLSVALVEMQDFAAGTSSRSTKLVHGGLRYLKQFEVKMVAEVGKEREIVYENAVHVTEPEWMLLPFHKGGTFGPISTSVGLRVYDFLAGVKRDERRQMLSTEETKRKEPLLKTEGLRGAGYYVEYRTDDARLTIEVIKKAAEKDAICVNYVKAESFVYNQGKINGAKVVDQLSGQHATIHAKNIVNATGPWVDDVRIKDSIENGKQLRMTKGVHVVVDQTIFPLKQAVYFDTPDGRMVFAIPRNGKTYVGTTDTFYGEDPKNPIATSEDVAYLLEAISFMFPSIQLSPLQVESTWAGVRPLIFEEGKDPSEISRKDEIWESASGLLTIAGGKLTGYRKMAEMVVNRVCKNTKSSYGPSITKHLPLSGGAVGGSKGFKSFVEMKALEGQRYGLSYDESRQLASFYGTNVHHLFAYASVLQNKSYGLPLPLAAKLAYGIQFEMTCTPADFFIRRTGNLYFNIDEVHAYKEQVCQMMKAQLGYSENQVDFYRFDLDKQMHAAIAFREEKAK